MMKVFERLIDIAEKRLGARVFLELLLFLGFLGLALALAHAGAWSEAAVLLAAAAQEYEGLDTQKEAADARGKRLLVLRRRTRRAAQGPRVRGDGARATRGTDQEVLRSGTWRSAGPCVRPGRC